MAVNWADAGPGPRVRTPRELNPRIAKYTVIGYSGRSTALETYLRSNEAEIGSPSESSCSTRSPTVFAGFL